MGIFDKLKSLGATRRKEGEEELMPYDALKDIINQIEVSFVGHTTQGNYGSNIHCPPNFKLQSTALENMKEALNFTRELFGGCHNPTKYKTTSGKAIWKWTKCANGLDAFGTSFYEDVEPYVDCNGIRHANIHIFKRDFIDHTYLRAEEITGGWRISFMRKSAGVLKYNISITYTYDSNRSGTMSRLDISSAEPYIKDNSVL